MAETKLKILVTGASGAVGFAVARALRQRGHQVRGFDREPARVEGAHTTADLRDFESLSQAVSGVDLVVHCAAVPDRQDFPTELVPTNIVGTHLVFEAARLAKVSRVIYASSIRVVGGLDWGSGTIGVGAGLVPGDHYGVSKATGELLARMYAERFGLSVLSARLGWFVRNLGEAELFETVRYARRIYLSHRDAEAFFVRAAEASWSGYSAVFVTSRNDGDSGFDLEPVRNLLDFEPADTWPSGSTWSDDMRFESPTFGPSVRPSGR
ncbi:MAG TPA: NAD(P)-dependent oxidoreductase [Polyangiaceae bacterium]|nr:NAD(P)-dependent oxidoreductase [Polyangiaceae bacterium]